MKLSSEENERSVYLKCNTVDMLLSRSEILLNSRMIRSMNERSVKGSKGGGKTSIAGSSDPLSL